MPTRLLAIACTFAILGVAGARPSNAQQPPPGGGAGAATNPDTIAIGKRIFEGKEGGAICFTCHAMNGRGTPGLGPNLADATWLHGDGSFAFIESVVTNGVAKAKQAAAPMPPMGGGKLSAAQVRAVAAYVYSLSRPR